MNILFVCENYIPHIGGAEVVFKHLAEGFVARGHKVSFVTHRIKGTKKYEVLNGVHVYRVESFHNRYAFTFLSLPTVIKHALKADVIQTTSFNGAPPAWLAGFCTGKKVAITIHEMWINKWQKVTDLSKVSCLIHNYLEKMVYALPFSKYLCVSDATRKDVLASGKKKEKVHTIYNGLDYEFWNKEKFDGFSIRKKLGVEDNFVYFSWGRPGMSKGFEYLIKAIPRIVKEIPNAKLILMLGGITTHKKRYVSLRKLISKLKMQEHIKLVPSAPYEELGNYLLAADCAVVPSIAEGFGFNAVEACALGVPLVASEIGSLPEVVSGKHVLVEAKNPRSIAEGVINVYNKKWDSIPLKKFMWDDAIESYLDVYEKLRKN